MVFITVTLVVTIVHLIKNPFLYTNIPETDLIIKKISFSVNSLVTDHFLLTALATTTTLPFFAW